VREEGFALVDIQMGQIKRPKSCLWWMGIRRILINWKAWWKGAFPKEEYEVLKEKQAKLRKKSTRFSWS